MTEQLQRKRAPRNTLNPELIVRTALELMDAEGVDSFGMRGLAKRLGVGPMALYTYFRGRDELLDAVRDHAMALNPIQLGGDTWQERVRLTCRGIRGMMLAHPCLVQLFTARPLAGHEVPHAVEALLSMLRAAGFDRDAAARAYLTLFNHVLGVAAWEVQLSRQLADREGRRQLRETMDSLSRARYPTLVDLVPELNRSNGDAQYEFGLDLLITGLERVLAQREAGPGAP
ncbi:TetR/AcrR family transcriptional regulator [Crossiella sp. CA-258035]|uniref:TetR/AcrR family transcriptional regulator n=1 Tax=Crossiella sp. CA-258035 TaxID=2981138 RepID=UPI0024BD44CC|nr:TetR/AcrR family transcriptional regulator [Crossiella sp. CA-258035]WHT22113.1 TetR/AcrR family transcriptional regulator [Crossiella sp. CA-258035]